MKTEYRYILEKGSKKYPCPHCNKKSFVRYLDTFESEYLPEQYGRCDRESKCEYHLSPYKDEYAETISDQREKVTSTKQKYFSLGSTSHVHNKLMTVKKPTYFDIDVFTKTLESEGYDKNIFILNLLYHVPFPFQRDEVGKVIDLYQLGSITKGYRAGAVTFPFIDFDGNIRAVQVKQFDKENHTIGTDFLHSIIEKQYIKNNHPLPGWLSAYNGNEKKVSCLFGEHLLKKYPLNPVALVEAPKTAVYGSLYFGMPQESSKNLIWLAVYNKSSFSLGKLNVLKDRDVFVFPDLSKDGNTFKEWETKAKAMENKLPGTRFIFSDLLETLSGDDDKNKGYDLADFLIKLDWKLFRNKPKAKQEYDWQKWQAESIDLTSSREEPFHLPEPLKAMTEVENTAEKADTIEPTQIISSHRVFPGTQPNTRTQKKQDKTSKMWDKKIQELETFFSDCELLNWNSIPLGSYGNISDVQLFIKNHLSIVKANAGKTVFLPYLQRLEELRSTLKLNPP
ncbi:DUF6965 family protein [Chryseobacterium lactis]|uniref:DUF6965 family protein n=1 Tax=Chryseobacterium lactis TaxID=1241981 RepID=UPI00161BC1EA|nr:DUF6371 domain-containing protein [Chryseobacterium lactis]